jgi:DNA-binding transcriptional regulator YdaS (Cro superfamily)
MKLRDYLREARITQQDFARRIGVTQGRLQQWFAGELIPAERALLIERESDGLSRVEENRPDLPWRRDADGRPLLDGFIWVAAMGRPAANDDTAPAEGEGAGNG